MRIERIERFKIAVAEAPVRPKGVKINPDFWKLLESENLIQMKQAGLNGMAHLSPSPFFDGDIWLIQSQEMLNSGKDFELPPSEQ